MLIPHTTAGVARAPQTSYPQYRAKQFTVQRRYRDFVRLHRQLKACHRDVAFPDLPPGKIAGRFQDRFLKERMGGLEDFANWCAPRRGAAPGAG